MLRTGIAAIAALFATALLIVMFASASATRTARTQLADRSAAAAPTQPAPAPAALDASSGKATVSSTEFKFSASEIHAPAGRLTLTLDNAGAVPHELVLLKSTAAPGSLRIAANGRVSEAASVGEVSELKSGATNSTTFNLKPGRYIYVCNIPSHYGSGMHGLLIVR